MFCGELDSDFLSIPSSPLSLFVLVDDLAIISHDIGFPRENVQDNTTSRDISEIKHRNLLGLETLGVDIHRRLSLAFGTKTRPSSLILIRPTSRVLTGLFLELQ